jgi:hypothetical protein
MGGYDKYIKYKLKYLDLKYNQFGGGLTWRELLNKWDKMEKFNIKFPKHSFAIKFHPFTGKDLDKEIKFVFFRRDGLYTKQNFSAFRSKFKNTKNCDIVSFYNLSKTSILIVPCPDKNKNYAHLNLFNKNATSYKKKKLWKKVSEEIYKIINEDNKKKIYLNTHGFGVPYLHVRIDFTPKYGYHFLNIPEE